jgi:hypothetical protein
MAALLRKGDEGVKPCALCCAPASGARRSVFTES